MIYFAELLLEMGEQARATSLLEELLALPPDGEWEFENQRDRQLASAMLERLRRH